MADGSVMRNNAQDSAGFAQVKVRYHRRNQNNTKYPINRLPFIDRKTGSCWSFPPSDGYGAGNEMGAAAADAFMKALRESTVDCGGHLQHLVLSLLDSGLDLKDYGRKGQVVGFFSRLDAWLSGASKMVGASLDEISEADIERRLTRAATESEHAHSARYQAALRARHPEIAEQEAENG